jgi:hypothetical protein
MKNFYVLICMMALATLSCKKSDPLPAPTAGFELALAIATQGATFTPLNTSQNATSYLWDFGDGTTSTEKAPTFKLVTIGDHKISLTVTNADGTTRTSSKNVRIVAPIITSITITNLQNWEGANFSSLKKFSGGDVWVEIKKSKTNAGYDYYPDGSYDYPLFYKSPVVNVPAKITQPIVIAITDKVVLDGDPTLSDERYSFNLYVKDAAGVHMLFTSDFMGSLYPDSFFNNSYSWKSSFSVGVELKGSYY